MKLDVKVLEEVCEKLDIKEKDHHWLCADPNLRVFEGNGYKVVIKKDKCIRVCKLVESGFMFGYRNLLIAKASKDYTVKITNCRATEAEEFLANLNQ